MGNETGCGFVHDKAVQYGRIGGERAEARLIQAERHCEGQPFPVVPARECMSGQ